MADVPISLKPAFKENFAPRNIHRTSQTTSKRRNELVANGNYIDLPKYNSRYKLDDIQGKLKGIYKNKCAYCEQKVEQFHVEHYRPKQTYCWIAFSWDNLICACSFCNEFKSTSFRINGAKATLTVNLASIKNINTHSHTYDASENPDMVNPEVTDPTGQIVFAKDGNISSANPRFDYTITTCRIHRTYLKDNRKKILDDFRRDLKDVFVDNTATADQETAIQTLVKKFIRDAANPENEFLAFRNYLLSNWINEEIKNAKI